MTGSKSVREKAKALWLKGMKAVGNTAANIANNTRYKVDEVTIQNRRREVLNDLAHKAYTIWLKGEGDSFPESMIRMLEELKSLDEQLNDMRAEKYALSQKNEKHDSRTGTPEDDNQTDHSMETEPDDEEDEKSPVSAEINNLFDNVPSVGKTANKVNQSLDALSDKIRNFSSSQNDEMDKEQE